MPSLLDRQLDAILAALGARLSAESGESVLVELDDLRQSEPALIEHLLRCGLLRPAEPAKAVICEGCDACCLMPMQFSSTAPGRPALGFVISDKRTDIGRVIVEAEQLRRWSVSWRAFARLAVQALGVAAEPIELNAGRLWHLGEFKRHNQTVEVVLARTPGDVPREVGLAILLFDPAPGTTGASIGIGRAIGFRNGVPVPRRRALEEALTRRLDDPTIVCEIRFIAGDIVLVNHLAGSQRLIASPRFNSSNRIDASATFRAAGEHWAARRGSLASMSRVGVPWSDDELRFVRENWERLDDAALAVQLRRSMNSVSLQRQRLGFKRSRSGARSSGAGDRRG